MSQKIVFGNDGPSNPDLKRSTFDKSFTNNLTCRLGVAYPCLVEMLCPNSTLNVTPHIAFDMFPMLSPIQSNIRAHLSYYKIPLRILWDNYKDFFSRVSEARGDGSMDSHVVPFISRTENWHETGSLADYMGIPSQLFVERSFRSRLAFSFVGYTNPDVDYYGGLLFGSLREFSTSIESHVVSSPVFYSVRSQAPNSSSTERFVYLSSKLKYKLSNGYMICPFIHSLGSTLPNVSHTSSNWYNLNVTAFITRTVRISGDSNEEIISFKTENYPGYSPRTLLTLDPGSFAFSTVDSNRTETIYGVQYSVDDLIINLTSDMVDFINQNIQNYNVFIALSWRTYRESFLGGGYYVFDGSTRPSITEIDGQLQQQGGDAGKIELDVKSPPIRLGITGAFDVYYSRYLSDVSNSPFCATILEGGTRIEPRIPINAFAFRAYEFIHNYFFRNSRVDPFYKDGVPTWNKFLTNTSDGADSTTPLEFFHVPYEYDLFTTAMPSPQFGNAPLVGITTNDSDATTATLNMVDPTSQEHYQIAALLDSSNQIVGIANYDEVADKTSVMRLVEAINFGISINDFRNVNAFQIMNERFLKAGYQYSDLVQEFFGVRPPLGEEFPEYLGGITRQLSIDPVMNVAQSQGNPLGEKAGAGFLSGHGEKVECFTKEWSIVMGILWFSVTPVYTQKLDKHFTYHHYLDFYNPQLANIGAQPIFKKQLTPLQLSAGHEEDVFGYGRAWSEMVSRQDEAHGDFRGSLYHYLLQRSFVEPPSLGHEFLTIDDKDLNEVWADISAGSSDKFYGAVRHEMYVTMPLPRVSIPHII